MSAITINVGTFTNEKWGKWEDDKGEHSAYLDLFEDALNVSGLEFMPKTGTIETINKFVKEEKPFIVHASSFKRFELDDRTVKWSDSDVSTRQAIVEKYVLAKLRTFGQEEHPPLTPINVDGLAQLIDYEAVAKDDTQPHLQVGDVKEKPALPGITENFNIFTSRKQAKEGTPDFLSCSARMECLWTAFYSLIGVFLLPVVMIMNAFNEDKWRNIGWCVLDTTLCVLITPLIFSAKIIQCLAGAIIHPAIALHE